jgi:hypothetical protein
MGEGVAVSDRDPGDEHRDPSPFSCGAVFEVRGDDGAVVAFYSKATPQWHTATATIERVPFRGYAYSERKSEP